MPNLDNPSPEDIAEVRDYLRRAGERVDTMSDTEAIDTMRSHIRERVVAPPPRAGAPLVNARTWLTEALTAGGFAKPEDSEQHADLGDGGESVHLVVLGVLVMRHTSGGQPNGNWSDEGLAAQTRQPVEDVRRAQALLDQVAADTGRPPAPRR